MPVFDGVFERIGYKTLTNNRFERCRSVFSCRYNKITGLHIGFAGFHFVSIYISRYYMTDVLMQRKRKHLKNQNVFFYLIISDFFCTFVVELKDPKKCKNKDDI